LDVRIPLPGEHQVANAVTAIRALESLQDSGTVIHSAALKKGLEATQWPGRLEIVEGRPRVILDGAHNPAGAESLKHYWQRFLGERRVVLMFGVMSDKAIAEIGDKLFPLADAIVLTAAHSERSADPAQIANQLPRFRSVYHLTRCPAEALDTAKRLAGSEGVVLVAGSLFLVGDIKRELNQSSAA
jgi:dihydrofolate synthase/folylpolyglutamate synthase